MHGIGNWLKWRLMVKKWDMKNERGFFMIYSMEGTTLTLKCSPKRELGYGFSKNVIMHFWEPIYVHVVQQRRMWLRNELQDQGYRAEASSRPFSSKGWIVGPIVGTGCFFVTQWLNLVSLWRRWVVKNSIYPGTEVWLDCSPMIEFWFACTSATEFGLLCSL